MQAKYSNLLTWTMENDTFLVPNSHELVNYSTESGNLEDNDDSDNIKTVDEENENEDNKGFVSILSKC